MSNKISKSELRSAGKSARNLLTQEGRELASGKICATAAHTSLFRSAKFIACYLATSDEVNCRELIKCAWFMKKRVFVPTIQKNSKLEFVEFLSDTETSPNEFGLQEPVDGVKIDSRDLDVVFTPLVAFDSQKNRIGMGGGYYDRTFSFLQEDSLALKPKLIGLSFDCQRVENIVASPWDIPLFHVITETGIVV